MNFFSALRQLLQAVLIALLTGAITTVLIAAFFIRLQSDAIDQAFPADQRPDQLAAHVNREIAIGPLLLLESGGVTCAALAWATSRMARHVEHPYRLGALAGAIVAGVCIVFAWRLTAPFLFTLPLAALIVGAGIIGIYLGQGSEKSTPAETN